MRRALLYACLSLATAVPVGLALAVLLQTPAWQRSARAAALVAEAQQLASQGRSVEARRKVDQAYALSPESPKVHRERGMQMMALGQVAEATAELRRAAEAQPHDVGAAWELAFALSASKQIPESVEWFQRVVSIERNNGAAYAMLANGELQLGHEREALRAAEIGVARSPRVPNTHFTLALVRWQLHDLRGAHREMEQALQLRPSDVQTLLALASVTGQMGRLDLAAGYLERAVRIVPRDATAWAALGRAYQGMRRNSQAQQAYRQALALRPTDEAALQGLAQLQAR